MKKEFKITKKKMCKFALICLMMLLIAFAIAGAMGVFGITGGLVIIAMLLAIIILLIEKY